MEWSVSQQGETAEISYSNGYKITTRQKNVATIISDTISFQQAQSPYKTYATLPNFVDGVFKMTWEKSSDEGVDLAAMFFDENLYPITTGYFVDWGDGVINTENSHIYSEDNTYNVVIYVPNVFFFAAPSFNITAIDLTSLPSGLYFLNLSENNIKEADLTNLPNGLYGFSLSENNISSVDLTNLPSGLYIFDLSINDITTIDLTSLPNNINSISLYNNKITTINLEYLPFINLNYFAIDGNELSSGIIDACIIDLNNIGYSNCEFILNNQNPPAPPTEESAEALAELLSRNNIVEVDS